MKFKIGDRIIDNKGRSATICPFTLQWTTIALHKEYGLHLDHYPYTEDFPHNYFTPEGTYLGEDAWTVILDGNDILKEML